MYLGYLIAVMLSRTTRVMSNEQPTSSGSSVAGQSKYQEEWLQCIESCNFIMASKCNKPWFFFFFKLSGHQIHSSETDTFKIRNSTVLPVWIDFRLIK